MKTQLPTKYTIYHAIKIYAEGKQNNFFITIHDALKDT